MANRFEAVKLKYAGGEASLNPRLLLSMHELARALATEHGLHLYATLAQQRSDAVTGAGRHAKAKGVRVMISLDGIGELHDAQRPFVSGRPSFKFVERTISQLIERITGRTCR